MTGKIGKCTNSTLYDVKYIQHMLMCLLLSAGEIHCKKLRLNGHKIKPLRNGFRPWKCIPQNWRHYSSVTAERPRWLSLQAPRIRPPHLQLLLIKVAQPLQWYHFIETVQEGSGLLFHAAGEPPVCQQAVEWNSASKFFCHVPISHFFGSSWCPFIPSPDVLLLVFLCN